MPARSSIVVVLIASASVLTPAPRAAADEGGVPFWFSGQFSSLAAVPATPGFSLPAMAYFYAGNGEHTESFKRGDSIAVGVHSNAELLFVQPTYAPDAKVLGGQLAASVGFGFGHNKTKADISDSALRGRELDRSDSIWGGSDMYPFLNLAWAKASQNGMVYLTGDLPVGAYDSRRLANIGIGHFAIDGGGGYTYLNDKNGHEFSAVVGLTYNFENPSTNYKNGLDSHLDWAASQFLSKNWEVGIAGYLYYQLTGDSGSGAILGPFKSKVASVGPEVGYAFKVGGLPAYANVRGYWEFWSENRLQGVAVFGVVEIPLGPKSKKHPAS